MRCDGRIPKNFLGCGLWPLGHALVLVGSNRVLRARVCKLYLYCWLSLMSSLIVINGACLSFTVCCFYYLCFGVFCALLELYNCAFRHTFIFAYYVFNCCTSMCIVLGRQTAPGYSIVSCHGLLTVFGARQTRKVMVEFPYLTPLRHICTKDEFILQLRLTKIGEKCSFGISFLSLCQLFCCCQLKFGISKRVFNYETWNQLIFEKSSNSSL